jgi:hypothetical protein
VTRKSEAVEIVKGDRRRRLHKAFLRYHDPNNWPLLREALKEMGRADLIGNGKHHLIPTFQPAVTGVIKVHAKKTPAKKRGIFKSDRQKRSYFNATYRFAAA